MWTLYDRLIAGIPENLTIDSLLFAPHFSMIRAGSHCGVAHTFSLESRPFLYEEDPAGRSLKDVARQIKSWNFKEASIGMAAINAWYNSDPNISDIGLTLSEQDAGKGSRSSKNAFSADNENIKGKNVAVIGHFRNIDKKWGPVCNLHVLEMDPGPGDYPSSACEFLLPEMDYIFATGTTLINKTLPRLLELKPAHAQFILVGPSGPLSPTLFDFGVDTIASFVINDPNHVEHVLSERLPGMFKGGQMVEYSRDYKSY